MELSKKNLLVAAGVVVAAVVGVTLFNVVQDLGSDPVVVEEAVAGDVPATEPAAEAAAGTAGEGEGEGEGETAAGTDAGVAE